jgi:hypothetical protein
MDWEPVQKMSFSSIKPYIRERLAAVSSDLREWEDGFNIQNIPETILDNSWHITFNQASQVSLNQDCLRYTYPITLNIFLKGYRSPADAIDNANLLGESILREVLKHANRLNIAASTTGKIINVLSTSFSLNPIDASNDNIVRLQIGFDCDIFIDIE